MSRVCLSGGALVPTDARLPTCLAERRFGPTVVGCNRLRCHTCDRFVTSAVEDGLRVYRCDCTTHTATGVRLLAHEGRDLLQTELPWRCAGHPDAVDADFDTLGYAPEAVFSTRFRAALEGTPEAPADLPPSTHRGYMADLLIDLVPESLEFAIGISESALDDPDAQTVRRALDVLTRRQALPLDRGLVRYQQLRGRADPFHASRDLSEVWADAIGRRAVHDGADSEAAVIARALRDAGAKARVLRQVSG